VQTATSTAPVCAEIGLGTATFGRESDAAIAHRLLDHGYAKGIRHLDTAAAYSNGAAETILGDWLRTRPGLRAGLTVTTKILPPYSVANIEASVTASLGRLGLESIDVLYLHRWDPTADQPSVRAALDALVQRGLAGALGISNCPLEKLQTTLGHQHAEGRKRFTWLQNNQNFAVREAPEAFRRYCAGQGINVVTFSPLGAGFLTGKHDAGVVPGSRFSVAPAHQDIYFNAPSRRRLEVLFTTAREFGLPQASLALAWALRRPNTRLVLIGGREPAQIDQAFAARDESLAKAVAKLETVSPDDPAI
jgi:aryl-alcohol dehydrogenase-like predicted oxidoreductase